MLELADIEGFTVEELHALLANGDARGRLLAVWALALRSTAVTIMANQLRTEPDPGVRRALAVVLAGEGELDLLVAMSRHDPNVHVRASASQILVRFAAADRLPWSMVTPRLADAPEVRAAVISQLGPASPPELRAAVVAALRDDSDLVRREAFEVAIRLERAGLLDAATLVDVLESVRDGELSHLLGMWLAVERPARLAELLESTRRDIRERVLLRMPELVYTDLARLLGDDVELYSHLAHTLSLPLARAPLPILLQLGARSPSSFDVLAEAGARLSKLDRLPGELAPLVRELAAACDDAMEPNGEPGAIDLFEDEYDDEPDPAQQGIVDALRAQIDRLL